MTLLTYQVFKTIADVGSFHKAADILGLTPSAISHAISSMENELGFSVLTRSKAGVSLTNYGEQLLPYVNAVLNCDESLKQEIAELNGLKQGKVKIGVFSSVCTSWLPEILHSFKKKYTEIGLYSTRLSFLHPVTGERMTFKTEPCGEAFEKMDVEALYTGSRTEL